MAFVRGELAPMREIADIVLREVAARPGSPEAVVSFRLNGAPNGLPEISPRRAPFSNALCADI